MSSREKHIDYVEFPASDIPTAKAFYGQVFGWTFTDYGPDYASFENAGVTGGFRKVAKPSAGGVLIVIYSADLAATERLVVAAGGVVTEREEFPGGKRFQFKDPVGNVVAVWKNE
jgi:uncharacterized protein